MLSACLFVSVASNGTQAETSGPPYTFAWTSSDTAQASIGVRARDNVSNTSAPAIVTFGVNRTPPTSQASAPAYANGVITVTLRLCSGQALGSHLRHRHRIGRVVGSRAGRKLASQWANSQRNQRPL